MVSSRWTQSMGDDEVVTVNRRGARGPTGYSSQTVYDVAFLSGSVTTGEVTISTPGDANVNVVSGRTDGPLELLVAVPEGDHVERVVVTWADDRVHHLRA